MNPTVAQLPDAIDPRPWLHRVEQAKPHDVETALAATTVDEAQMAALLSPAALPWLETMAQRARGLTQRHFGRTIHLYAPLYLSSFCNSGCVYCGFSARHNVPRHKLDLRQTDAELAALKANGIEEVLLLTGERTRLADIDYVCAHTERASQRMHQVTAEVFPMEIAEYQRLAACGCVGISLYQETYDPVAYARYHLFGKKRDYQSRVEGPARALAGGLRTVGLGALLGLALPAFDMLALFRHARWLQKQFWQAGLSLSFPRIQPQTGDFMAPYAVSDRELAQIIFAFRIAFPTFPLVLSTRECAAFRDGMAGLGISKMSVASKTTVGGYSVASSTATAQFSTSDDRDGVTFCAALRERGFEPIFKDWDQVYRQPLVTHVGVERATPDDKRARAVRFSRPGADDAPLPN